jgi:predicted PurR-regulated permease PerM
MTTTHWINHSFFKYGFGVLLILTILLVLSNAVSILFPIVNFISILLIPIALSLFFYYLLRPIVKVLEEKAKTRRWMSILMIYLIFGVILVFSIAYLVPVLIQQMTDLANISMSSIEKAKDSASHIFARLFNLSLDQEIQQRLYSSVQQLTSVISQNAMDAIAFLTRTAVILAVIPFIVFYLLKDDDEFAGEFLGLIPGKFGKEVKKILHNMDETLASYIQGLVMISFCTGSLLFIGYLIIGLNYALILSVFSFIAMTIPYVGPFIAICPALLVGLADSPFMILKVIIVFMVVQQIESNLISPQVIGHKLNIFPITIILLLLAAGSLYGLVGLILVTPCYALAKVLIEHLHKIYRLRYSMWKKND